MKRITLSLLLFFASIGAFAQCPPGDLDLLSQAQLNQFAIDYPNCTTIAGRLLIGAYSTGQPSDITNVSPLGNITAVNGDLSIRNNGLLQNVNGLNINTVGGNLYVGGDSTTTNPQLQNIDGLSSLTSVGGYVSFFRNII